MGKRKAKQTRPKKTILGDHKRTGKKFIPPMATLGWKEIHYIEWIIPEIIWMGYFARVLGENEGLQIVADFIQTGHRIGTSAPPRELGLLSTYRAQEKGFWLELKKELEGSSILEPCRKTLAPFLRCYPESNPIGHLFEGVELKSPTDGDIALARNVVSDLFDRRSRSACIVQSVVLYVDVMTDKLKFVPGIKPPDLNAIFCDFESEAAKHACSHVRTHLNSAYAFCAERIGDGWARYFWNRGKELVPIKSEIHIPEISNKPDVHPLVSFATDYGQYAWHIIDEIWTKMPIDVYEDELFAVLGALLARQCNLAVKIAENCFLWDYHAGPLFLRPMTDCYITAAWILKDPKNRAKKFILHGLGQEKLNIEHMKSVLLEYEPKSRKRLQEAIDAREGWVNSQHFAFLQDVDVGSWSGISTREMALDAGCIDLYNFAYLPWSHAAHGMWNHIGCFDARPSPEPLHKHIWQPVNFEHGKQVDVVENATKYFDKLCTLVVAHFKLKIERPQPRKWFGTRLTKLFQEMPDAMVAEEGDVADAG